MITYVPKNILLTAYEGNSKHPSTPLSDINSNAEVFMTYHLGFRKEVDQQWTIGARFKLYSSILQYSSTVGLPWKDCVRYIHVPGRVR